MIIPHIKMVLIAAHFNAGAILVVTAGVAIGINLPLPPPPYPSPLPIISLMVFVDVTHHVYLLGADLFYAQGNNSSLAVFL